MKSIPLRTLSLFIFCLFFAGGVAANAAYSKTITEREFSGAGCLPQDSLAIDLKDELVQLMGRTDAMADTLLAIEGITRVATTQIAIVVDSATCARAANAYSTSVSLPDPNRLVHAIRAGIRYLVMDPTFRNGPHKVGITFDSSFTQKISSFIY